MNRSELKRTPFARKEPMSSRTLVAEPKPPRGPRMRKCAVCRNPFVPRSMTHKACGQECATTLATVLRQKQERKADRERKQSMKTRQQWIKEAQAVFNSFIRARDSDKPCICCGVNSTTVDGLHSHAWDCGHYRSTGSAPHLRFNEDNAHRQKVLCNRHGSGRAVDYRIGLIARIGLARVEALEADQTPRKWTIDELIAIKAHYKLRLKQLQEAK